MDTLKRTPTCPSGITNKTESFWALLTNSKRLFRLHLGGCFAIILALLSGSAQLLAQANAAGLPSSSSTLGTGYNTAAATVATTTSMDVLENSRKLGKGDQISFRVVEDRDPPYSLSITDSGEMEVPYIGRVKAAGLTCRELAYSIKKALLVDYYYHATVIIGLDKISDIAKGTVYVSGEVVTRGPIEIPANESLTASNAITRAGGFVRFSDKRKISIIRKTPDGKTQIIPFDYVRVIEKGHVEEDVTLQPGDIINVPAASVVF